MYLDLINTYNIFETNVDSILLTPDLHLIGSTYIKLEISL